MTAIKFDQIVEARTNERAQERINVFRTTVRRALEALLGRYNGYYQGGIAPTDEATIALAALVTTDRKWPKRIWALEQEAVTTELLGTLDEMTKAIMAASKPANPEDAKPTEEAVK